MGNLGSRLAMAILLLAGGCAGSRLDPHDDGACLAAVSDRATSADAADWLRIPSAGAKRVGNLATDDALAFVHLLIARGARRVVAVGIRSVGGSEPTEAAQGLVVELPEDASARHALFQLHAKQLRASGIEPRADEGRKFLYYAW